MSRSHPLWQCPKCKREFANRHQSHSCGSHDLEHHFAGKRIARELDAEFRSWLSEAYAVGAQEHLVTKSNRPRPARGDRPA